jgi:hypothetical protein
MTPAEVEAAHWRRKFQESQRVINALRSALQVHHDLRREAEARLSEVKGYNVAMHNTLVANVQYIRRLHEQIYAERHRKSENI